MTFTNYLQLVVFLTFSVNLFAQTDSISTDNYIIIKGKVAGRETGAISMAYVVVWSDQQKEIEHTYTDTDGFYMLILHRDSVQLEYIDLIFSATGYETARFDRVSLKPGEILKDMYLKLSYDVIDCRGTPITNDFIRKVRSFY